MIFYACKYFRLPIVRQKILPDDQALRVFHTCIIILSQRINLARRIEKIPYEQRKKEKYKIASGAKSKN